MLVTRNTTIGIERHGAVIAPASKGGRLLRACALNERSFRLVIGVRRISDELSSIAQEKQEAEWCWVPVIANRSCHPRDQPLSWA